MTMRNTLFSLSLAAGMMALASQASASEPAQPAISVAYHDLDLASDSGRAELDRRIDRAARSVCNADQRATGTLLPRSEARTCVRAAKAQLETRLAQLMPEQNLGG